MGGFQLLPPIHPFRAKILLPLTAVLKGGKMGSDIQEWLPAMGGAFTNIKAALMQSVCLAFPSANAELSLPTDASATHAGAVLQQRERPSAGWQPLGFFSAKLETAQLSYRAFDRELYSIFTGIPHFRHHLEHREFTANSPNLSLLLCRGCPTPGQPFNNDSSLMWPNSRTRLSTCLAA